MRTKDRFFIVEVRNVARVSESVVADAILHAKYYNSMLRDALSKIKSRDEELPKASSSIVVFPRQGLVRRVDGYLPNFEEVCRRIWGVKRMALVDGKVPDVKVPRTVCRYCGYKKICPKFERDEVPEAKPLPVVFAVAEKESGDLDHLGEVAEARAKILEVPDFTMRLKLETLLRFAERDILIKRLYRALPQEFEEWGGVYLLNCDFERIKNAATFFELHKDDVLNRVRRAWGV